MSVSGNTFKYYAFISYSHKDKKWGDWLHHSLETFTVPKRLAGKQTLAGVVPQKIAPIFRDREELPTSSDLGSMINQALEDSRYLIVICSPDSARSRWVNEEVLAYKRMGRANRILAIIVDGEPNAADKGFPQVQECFCDALKYELDANQQLSLSRSEPIAADARPGKDGKPDARLKLIAGLLGIGFDELKQRELQRRQKRLLITSIVSISIAVITIFLAISAYIARNEAVMQRQEAVKQKTMAEEARDTANKNLAAALFEKAYGLYRKRRFNEAAILAAEAWTRDPAIYYPGLFSDYSVLTPVVNILATESKSGVSDLVVNDHFLYSGHYDNYLRKWDIESGNLLQSYSGHTDKIRVLAASLDNKYLASGSYDGSVRIQDTGTGRNIMTFTGHNNRIYSVALSPDGKVAASGDSQGNIMLWQIPDGTVLQTMLPHPSIPVMHLGFLDNGNTLISSSHTNGDLIRWTVPTGRPERLFTNANYGIWGFDVFKNQKTVVFSAGEKRTALNLVDIETGSRELVETDDNDIWFSDVSLDADDSLLVASSRSGHINLFNLEKETWLTTILAHSKETKRALFSSHNNYVISCGLDGVIRIWDTSYFNQPRFMPFSGGNARIEVMQISADKNYLAVGDVSGTIRIWDTETGESHFEWQEKDNSIIDSLALTSDNKGIFTGGSNKLKYIDFSTLNVTEFDYAHSPVDSHILAMKDGRHLLRDSVNGKIEIFDLSTNSVVRTLDNHRTESYVLEINADESILAAGGFENEIDLWNIWTGKLISTLKGHSDLIRDLDFNNHLLVSGGGEGEVILWDIHTGRVIARLENHVQTVFGVAFSPDGKYIASGGLDQKISIWETDSGKLVLTLYGEPQAIRDIEFGHDNQIIFIAYFDGTVRKIDLRRAAENPDEHLKYIRRMTGLKVDGFDVVSMDSDEWQKY